MSERWLPIPGFDGYEVSDRGRVRSLDRLRIYERVDRYSGLTITVTRRHKGRVLRPGRSGPYLSVVLGREAGSKNVHILVLNAFVGPCPAGHEGCHWDDIGTNNALMNLRWATRSDNLHDAVRNGGKLVGERHQGAKLRNSDVPVIRVLLKDKVSSEEIGRRYGVSGGTIRQIRRGRTWASVP